MQNEVKIKTEKKRIVTFLSEDDANIIEKLANDNKRSVASQVAYMLEEILKNI